MTRTRLNRGSRIPSLTVVAVIMAVCIQAESEDVVEHTAFTEDSLKISLWVTESGGDTTAPVFVLLPMMAQTHDSYDPFVAALKTALAQDPGNGCDLVAPNFISFDLRGHGQSTIRGKDTLSYRTMKEPEFARYPMDVKQTVESVWPQVVKNGGGCYLVGASIGANTAIMTTELLPNVSKVVMLSPGEDYRGLQPGEALKKFKGKVLIFACEGDQYSAESSRKLAALDKKHCTLHIFEGDDHGTDIIDNNPEAMKILIDWLCAP
jgi:pimeloyl-ACP methyl ester carboxylesterase